jgi:hemerythrin
MEVLDSIKILYVPQEETEEQLTKRGTVRKRKPKTKLQYFTQDTEDAIIEYLATTGSLERNRIYNERINYAFHKLTENIIHTFKFYYTEVETIAELQHEVTAVLLEKLHLYHHSKNINDRLFKIIVKQHKGNYVKDSFIEYTNNASPVTQLQINDFISTLNVNPLCLSEISLITPPKAFSYFGTITKRYLINYNNKNFEKLKGKATVESIDEDKSINIDILNNHSHHNDPLTSESYFIEQFIKYMDLHMSRIFPDEEDCITSNAIMELFRHRENLDIFNKKAIYIYIREQTSQDTPQITKVIKNLKKVHYRLLQQYLDYGYVDLRY